jgi:hypothetical protein
MNQNANANKAIKDWLEKQKKQELKHKKVL